MLLADWAIGLMEGQVPRPDVGNAESTRKLGKALHELLKYIQSTLMKSIDRKKWHRVAYSSMQPGIFACKSTVRFS